MIESVLASGLCLDETDKGVNLYRNWVNKGNQLYLETMRELNKQFNNGTKIVEVKVLEAERPRQG